MSYTLLTRGGGPGGTYIYGSPWGFQEAESSHGNFVSLAARRAVSPLVLGGARSDRRFAAAINTLYDHDNYWDVKIDWTELSAGWTVVARIDVLTDSGGSVTPSIRNRTDSVDLVGTSVTSASWVEQPITIPVPGVIGTKTYRLQWKADTTTIGMNLLGVIEIYA